MKRIWEAILNFTVMVRCSVQSAGLHSRTVYYMVCAL